LETILSKIECETNLNKLSFVKNI